MRVTNIAFCLVLALALFVFVAALLTLGLNVEIDHRTVSIVVFGGSIIGVALLAIAVVSDIIRERAKNGKQSR